MRRKVLVVAWITLNLLAARKETALAQEHADQRRPNETAKNRRGPKPEEPAESGSASSEYQDASVTGLTKRFLTDQRRIWTSPAQVRLSDAGWLVPLGGFTSLLFVTDQQFSRHLSHNPTTLSHYKTLSDTGVRALIGTAGGLWLMSYPSHNSHWQETGFLSAEAALNSLVAVEALKNSLGRQRPYQGNGNGDFFQSKGTSFPSEHAAAAFSVAGVLAHEYPGPVPKILAYGLASAVALSQVKARQHFNSDVLVGGVIGEMVAQSVYSRHFGWETGGTTWTSTSEYFRAHWKPSPKSFGSPFVPLDSWIYPALERLAAMGFLKTEFEGIKPWTRLECVDLYEQAEAALRERAPEFREANGILSALRAEFTPELQSLEDVSNHRLQTESVYTRMTGISGRPINDSYHFGQTLINDDGRPYAEGYNNITGFSGYGVDGRFTLSVSGEYQHAPSAAAFSLPQRQIIANADGNPVQPAEPVAEVNRFSLQDTYVATNIEGWNFSFGKQSLWWGPDAGSAFLVSNNAVPAYMFHLGRITPFELPWMMRYFGPAKIDFFFGRPQGEHFPGRPLMHGVKISIKPTPNLELGFAATAEFGGIGRPVTAKAILNSFIAYSSSVNYGPADNPGKRTAGFDFTYRLPFVRDWVSLYLDSLSPDDPSPLAAPHRAAVNPGIYVSHFPRLPWLDLRLEAVSTETPARDPNPTGGRYIYWEAFYHDLYTNQGNLMGSWIGREGKGYQAWSTAHFGPKNDLQLAYRHAEVATDFIPRGESITDGSVRLNRWFGRETSISVFLQYEYWNAPVLAPTPQSNWTSSLQLEFWPRPRK